MQDIPKFYKKIFNGEALFIYLFIYFFFFTDNHGKHALINFIGNRNNFRIAPKGDSSGLLMDKKLNKINSTSVSFLLLLFINFPVVFMPPH